MCHTVSFMQTGHTHRGLEWPNIIQSLIEVDCFCLYIPSTWELLIELLQQDDENLFDSGNVNGKFNQLDVLIFGN